MNTTVNATDKQTALVNAFITHEDYKDVVHNNLNNEGDYGALRTALIKRYQLLHDEDADGGDGESWRRASL